MSLILTIYFVLSISILAFIGIYFSIPQIKSKKCKILLLILIVVLAIGLAPATIVDKLDNIKQGEIIKEQAERIKDMHKNLFDGLVGIERKVVRNYWETILINDGIINIDRKLDSLMVK